MNDLERADFETDIILKKCADEIKDVSKVYGFLPVVKCRIKDNVVEFFVDEWRKL